MKEDYRMYFLTLYNISEIQKGIQCGHASLEYVKKYFNDEDFQRFLQHDKTWVILNGGSSLDLFKHVDWFLNNNVKFAIFSEPDLNDSLTSIAFLVPNKVFNKKDFPDFVLQNPNDFLLKLAWDADFGESNLKFRDFLKQFRLA